MLHQKHNTTPNRLHEKNAPTIGRKENERALFPSKNILSKVERGEVMAYVSDELLNQAPLQYSTTSIDGTQNAEVEDNEINIGIAQHEVRQEEELVVENEAAGVYY